MFEQAFKNIDDVLWKEAGCTRDMGPPEQIRGVFVGFQKVLVSGCQNVSTGR